MISVDVRGRFVGTMTLSAPLEWASHDSWILNRPHRMRSSTFATCSPRSPLWLVSFNLILIERLSLYFHPSSRMHQRKAIEAKNAVNPWSKKSHCEKGSQSNLGGSAEKSATMWLPETIIGAIHAIAQTLINMSPTVVPSVSGVLESLLLPSSNNVAMGTPFKYHFEKHPLNFDSTSTVLLRNRLVGLAYPDVDLSRLTCGSMEQLPHGETPVARLPHHHSRYRARSATVVTICQSNPYDLRALFKDSSHSCLQTSQKWRIRVEHLPMR